MPKRIRSKIEKQVDAEFEAKTKEELIAEFDQSQALHVPAKKRESKLISIRLPTSMLKELRDAATKKGDIGYQQLIKVFIADSLSVSRSITALNISEPVAGAMADTQGSSLICRLQTFSSVSGDYPMVA